VCAGSITIAIDTLGDVIVGLFVVTRVGALAIWRFGRIEGRWPVACGGRGAADRPTEGGPMGFDQYHEPPDELPAATRTFARLCASLTEEAEAIGWYEQRLAVETDPEAAAIMRDAQGEEFKHFSMDLEFLLRRTPRWREIAMGVLFQAGDIVEHGEEAEAEVGAEDAPGTREDPAGSLGIGSLKGAVR
jgi:uncharacterized protein